MFAEIEAFTMPSVFNPWRDDDPMDVSHTGDMFCDEHGAAGRRKRLSEHFDCVAPQFLLIGEAPGYQGCHFSGVPFTNEKLLMGGAVPRVNCPGRITTRGLPWCEPSATIVWRVLHELGIAERTVMWNAFAWHPYKPGEPLSNRAPTGEEMVEGLHVLGAVTQHFSDAWVFAVGKIASKALRRLGVHANGDVRHPSMGGATEFRSELSYLVAKRRADEVQK